MAIKNNFFIFLFSFFIFKSSCIDFLRQKARNRFCEDQGALQNLIITRLDKIGKITIYRRRLELSKKFSNKKLFFRGSFRQLDQQQIHFLSEVEDFFTQLCDIQDEYNKAPLWYFLKSELDALLR